MRLPFFWPVGRGRAASTAASPSHTSRSCKQAKHSSHSSSLSEIHATGAPRQTGVDTTQPSGSTRRSPHMVRSHPLLSLKDDEQVLPSPRDYLWIPASAVYCCGFALGIQPVAWRLLKVWVALWGWVGPTVCPDATSPSLPLAPSSRLPPSQGQAQGLLAVAAAADAVFAACALLFLWAGLKYAAQRHPRGLQPYRGRRRPKQPCPVPPRPPAHAWPLPPGSAWPPLPHPARRLSPQARGCCPRAGWRGRGASLPGTWPSRLPRLACCRPPRWHCAPPTAGRRLA